MFYGEKVLSIKEAEILFPEPLDSQSNTLLLICTECWISVPHNKIPGTETEPTALTSHQRFMPSRSDLSKGRQHGASCHEKSAGTEDRVAAAAVSAS